MAKIDFIEILYESFESFEYNPDLWKSRALQKTNLFHDFETSHAFFFFFFWERMREKYSYDIIIFQSLALNSNTLSRESAENRVHT